jgi:hypothetical protein
LSGKEKFTSTSVKALAGILREKIERLGAAEDKKTEAGTENGRAGLFAQEKEI